MGSGILIDFQPGDWLLLSTNGIEKQGETEHYPVHLVKKRKTTKVYQHHGTL